MRDLELWELFPAPATRNAKNRYPLDQGGRAPGQEGPGRSRYPSWLPGRRGEAREVRKMQKKRHCLKPGDGKRTRSSAPQDTVTALLQVQTIEGVGQLGGLKGL